MRFDPFQVYAYSKRKLLKRYQYISIVAITATLAIVQLLLLPKYLDASAFALSVVGISVIQAFQQFGDLGFSNASLRKDLDTHHRLELRQYAASISAVCLIAVGLSMFAFSFWQPQIALIVSLAAASAWVLTSSKLRAATLTHAGNEKNAAVENVVWQNGPKVGMTIASTSGSGWISIAGGLASALVLGRPQLPTTLRIWRPISQNLRLWVPGLGIVLAAFLMNWIETYTLTSIAGLEITGQYQAILRPMVGVTYVYLPLVALSQVALNSGDTQRAWKISFVAVGLNLVGTATLCLILINWGASIWPNYLFQSEVVITAAASANFGCISAVIGNRLLVKGKHGSAAFSTAGGAILLLLLSVILIPRFGITGAATASMFAWFFVASAQILAVIFFARERVHHA